MNNSATNTIRLLWAGLRMLLVLTVVTGILYPLAVTGVAQALFNDKANGSEIKSEGKVVGSGLIGQSWNIKGTDKPDPKWFQPRPSNSNYDPLATGSSQLGASDPTLKKAVEDAKKQVAAFNEVPESEVPKDAVTGSAPRSTRTSPRSTRTSRSSASPRPTTSTWRRSRSSWRATPRAARPVSSVSRTSTSSS